MTDSENSKRSAPDPGNRGNDRRAAGPDCDPLTKALRSAYQTTVDEGVPDEFLDLIRKLD